MTSTPPGLYADDLALALSLADEADAISHARFRAADLDVSLKADKTHVTDADKAVEHVIRDRLAIERPSDAFYGEESGKSSVDAGEMPSRQWIVDPIDGTANFFRGVPVWATLIALVVDGVPVVGVVSAPALHRRWWASQGDGALSFEGPLSVSTVETLADASLSYNGLQYWMAAGRVDQLLTLAETVWRTRAYGDFWAYMLVAEGAVDIAGEFDLQPYDVAALYPIVTEAGGRFSGMDGDEGIWHGSALATNALLHDAVLDAVALPRA